MISQNTLIGMMILVGLLVLIAVMVGYMMGLKAGSMTTNTYEIHESPSEPEIADAEVIEPDDEPEPEPAPETTANEPLEMHPDIEPTWRVAKKDRPDLRCSCHGRGIKAGERVLWWTLPSTAVRLFHEDFIMEKQGAEGA